MLTYTFSKREKIMLGLLVFVGLVVLWYRFVFMTVNDRVADLNSQIANVQNETITLQTQTASLQKMKKTIEEYTAKGYPLVYLPNYDNTQNLMAYLNGVLGATQGYDITFDEPTLSEEDGTIHRTGTISYETGSYDEARSIAENIARGPYPCLIEGLGISNKSSQGKSSSSDTPTFTSSLEVTFMEKPSSGTTLSKDKGDSKGGQDLSQMSNWDK